jgi:subfamily B ATP-binding cassette protein MsbA
MNYFKQILGFAKPYKKFAILNIICNVFYALFSALSFIALIPMLDVLFPTTKPSEEKEAIIKPVWNGIANTMDYFKDFMSYRVNEFAHDDSSKALILVIALVILLFFLKNISNYLAMFFITFLRNGVLKDLRNAIFDKLPSFQKKEKAILWQEYQMMSKKFKAHFYLF